MHGAAAVVVTLAVLAPAVASAQGAVAGAQDAEADVQVPEGYAASAEARHGPVEVDVVHYGGGPFRLFARRDGGPRQGPLCTTPCTLRLTPGSYLFDLGEPFAPPRRADGGPFRIPEGRRQILSVHHDRRAGERVAGWILFTLAAHAIAGGLVPVVASGVDLGTVGIAAMISLPIAIPLGAVALPLMFLQDSSRVEQLQPSVEW